MFANRRLTLIDVIVARRAVEAGRADTFIRINTIITGGVVKARLASTIIDVIFASITVKTKIRKSLCVISF